MTYILYIYIYIYIYYMDVLLCAHHCSHTIGTYLEVESSSFISNAIELILHSSHHR